jgi:glycosyltransferase involved in cell wall biosynthesis
MSTKKPCVLHLIPSLGAGGAEKQLIYLSGGLVEAGWDVHVAFTARGPNFHLLEASGATLRPIPSSSNYDPMMIPRIVRHIGEARPAIIQTWNSMMDLLGGPISRFMGIPWIMSERNSPDFFPRSTKIALRERLGRFATGIVSNSQSGDEYWSRHAGPHTHRYVIRNALPFEQIAAVPPANPKTFDLPASAPLILYAGRFEDQKNIDMLVAGVARALANCDAVALLCGEGPLLDDAVREIERLGLSERVRFPGFVPDIWSWLKRAELMISVSHFEGMPNTVMEAMACRCALVVSEISMHREILDESSAILVDRTNPELIAQAILGVLRDPKSAGRRIAAAHERAIQWSIASGTRDYVKVYCEIMGIADSSISSASS